MEDNCSDSDNDCSEFGNETIGSENSSELSHSGETCFSSIYSLNSPTSGHIDSFTNKLITGVMNSPIDTDTNSPNSGPLISPIKGLIKHPINSPISSPTNNPINSPTKSPVNNPIISSSNCTKSSQCLLLTPFHWMNPRPVEQLLSDKIVHRYPSVTCAARYSYNSV